MSETQGLTSFNIGLLLKITLIAFFFPTSTSFLLKITLIAIFIPTSTSLDCQNNTQGPLCEECKSNFVQYAINGTQCVPCKEFCHGHSDLCFSREILAQISENSNISFSNISFSNYSISTFDISEIDLKKYPGPRSSKAICLNCLHNMEGDRCDSCSTGFFKASDSVVDGCIPCHCHGHGDVCDPVTGEDCNCSNNTETPRECLGKHVKGLPPCWQLQCARCKEYFLGLPTHGHQCYRHLFLDKDYCFDPETHDECSRFPSPLLAGRTVFFAVQPRYMNVDIRVIIDVTSGSIDLYMSSKEDTFIVDVNKTTSHHQVWLDSHYELLSGDKIPSNMILVKQSYKTNDSDFGTLLTYQTPYKLRVRSSEPSRLITHVTLEDSNELLLVPGLKNRLVITIPQELHDLRSKRFYLILKGSTSTTFGASEESTGNLFVRQDQSRIDLFVFFSVFFSCFFLFLASCVLFWKIKQAFDLRTARRLHVAEMKHLASRPFATVPILIPITLNESDYYEFALSSPARHLPTDKKQLKQQLKVKG